VFSEPVESTAESVLSPSASLLDAEMSPPPEIAAEASTLIDTAIISTPEPASDIAVPANPEITSTLDHATPSPPSKNETAILYLALKGENPLPHHCPNRYRNPDTPYPPDCPPPREPARTILAGLAKDVLRHIACSTSPICTISRINDKYEKPWDIFARFQCDGKGGWEPETGRDGFDRFLGWVPEECKLQG
jgi:hypothetical protein